MDADGLDLGQRLAYLELDDADRQRLAAIAPALKAASRQFVETFYQHLYAFPETARFLRDTALVERLKEAQRQHLETMLDAHWDAEFVSQRRKIGDVHAQMGVTPQMFMGAYYQYLQFGLRKLMSPWASAPAKSPDGKTTATTSSASVDHVLSLLKATFLDIELTLDAYFLQATLIQRHALDMLFTANSSLRQFAHLTSHDLKTPLSTMANLCDEALDEFGAQMPDEARRLIGGARDRAFRMSRSIDELLNSSMTCGDGVDQVVDLGAVLDAAAEAVRPLVERNRIQLKISGPLPTVLGDAILLREVFFNLLSNAAKFTQPGEGRIVVDVEMNGDECTLSVSDNGPGIPREELGEIFRPFHRLRQQRDVPGSGLGLYFTKNIVEQLGGRIWADSTAGEGSTFFVTLKRACFREGQRGDGHTQFN